MISTFSEIVQLLQTAQIVPVIVLKEDTDVLALGQKLIDQGIAVAEVTFRTPQAEAGIRTLRQAYPEMLVGAGTILTLDELDRAIAAGAQFCVAPGLSPTIVQHAQAQQMPFIPGIATASELTQALELGCKMVKFFPAETSGGIAQLKGLMAAFGHKDFCVMPTGGITETTYRDWLAVKGVVCVGGSWVIKN